VTDPTPNPHPRPGRRTLLTPELREAIVRIVKAGNYLNTAAQYCGVGESTVKLWMQKGRNAAAAVDAHDPGGLYCPDCDTERTEHVQEVHRLNLEEDERREARIRELPPGVDGSDEPHTYATIDRCPSCHTTAHPRTWTLNPGQQPYLDLLAAVTQAQTAAEVAAVTHWRAAFAEDWRAARDFLVRKNPQAWAATTRVQLSQEEAERRIDAATEAVLGAVGLDTDQVGSSYLAAVDQTALAGLDLDLDSEGDWDTDDGDA
jgi:hypothetical protein